MKLQQIHRLDRFATSAALWLSVMVLPCLIILFVGCSSPSTSQGLYFLKVDLTDFPNVDHLFPRGLGEIDGVDASAITHEGNTAAEDVTSTVHGHAGHAGSEVTSAIHHTIQSEAEKLKSQIPQYYSVGLWSYCKSRPASHITCSSPRLKFAFDLSSMLESTGPERDQLLEKIDEATISGFRHISHAIITLYISSLVATVLAVVLGTQKAFYDRGRRLLSICSPLAAALIVAATAMTTIAYGLLVTEVNSKLKETGIKAVLGSRMFGTAWLAVFLSIGSCTTWLILLWCCCI